MNWAGVYPGVIGPRVCRFRLAKVKYATLSIDFRWAVAVVGPRLVSIRILFGSTSNLIEYWLRPTLTAHWTKTPCRLLLNPGEKTMLVVLVLRQSRRVKVSLPCEKSDHTCPSAEYTRHLGTCMSDRFHQIELDICHRPHPLVGSSATSPRHSMS